MTLLELILKKKINFRKGCILPTDGYPLTHRFDISPKEFLSFSKQDFVSGDKRGRINALSNTKRAIDCQTDKIFYCFGINPAKFPNSVTIFIKDLKIASGRKDIKPQLLFLQAMGFAPASIIANTRSLRHGLEHFYKEPIQEQVSEAIDLAELYISATDSKLNNVWNYVITDEEEKSHEGIKVKFNTKNHLFEIVEMPITIDDILGQSKKEKVIIKNDKVEFFHLMKISTALDYETDTQEALVELLELIKHPIPRQHVRINIDM